MADPRQAAVAAGYRLASALVRATPAPILAGATTVAGLPLSVGLRDRRSIVARHLRRVDPTLGGFALRRAVQESFQSYARYYAEAMRLPSLSTRTVQRGFEVLGIEHIDEPMREGRGAILALPHLGGWEWAGRWLADRGYGLTAVAERLDNPEVYEWFVDLRRRIGIEVVPLDDSAGVAVLEALRRNRVVTLLCDRDIPRDGRRSGSPIEFFGEHTALPVGPALFALRTGAPLLPVATYFTDRVDGHLAVVERPITVERLGALREDLDRVTQVLTRRIESLIRRAPTQWHLFQPNWPSDPGYDA